MPIQKMPYIKFATENYVNPKYNLAKSDVAPPNLEKYINNKKLLFFLMLQEAPYTLMKEFMELISKAYNISKDKVELTIGVTNFFSQFHR